MTRYNPTIVKMIEKDHTSKWYMPGTERTGQFATILTTELGKIGFRLTDDYRGRIVRVRVEPKNADSAEKLGEKLTRANGWKQPTLGGEYRFSNTFTDAEQAIAAIEAVIKLLGATNKDRRRGTIRYWRFPIRQYLPALAASPA
jgi:hypothetical protein